MKYEAPWYFSEAGKAAYQKADMLSKKIEHIYNYFLAEKRKYSNDYHEYEYACLLAYCAEKLSLPFSSYPDMIDKEKNPLAKLCLSGHTDINTILAAIQDIYSGIDAGKGNSGDKNNRYKVDVSACEGLEYPHKFPWEDLDFPKDGKYSEKYVLERLAIWLFVDEYRAKDVNFSPYSYN